MKNRFRCEVSAIALVCAAGLAQAQDFPQAFDDIVALTTTGNWFTQNNSAPGGLTGYFQGNDAVFPSFASLGYLGTNFNNTTGTNTISNWFVTPALNLENGQVFTFYTRSVTANPFPDRLQVRMSTNGFSTNVGTLPTDVGDFTIGLLDINPTYQPSPAGYPDVWTQQVINISGLTGPTVGRIAFRYFVENGGPTGANSNYIGIDEATFTGTVAAVPTGACCLPDGTCQVLTTNQCTGTAGVYQGNGSACGACPVFGFVESTDVGALPANAQQLTGTGSLTKIVGNLDLDDVDMYQLNVCDRPNFTATTTGGPAVDSIMYLFGLDGRGIAKDDDVATGATSLVTGQFLAGNGDVYLAVSLFERDAIDNVGNRIWNQTNPAAAFFPEWQPNGPGAANPVANWANFTQPGLGSYIITLTGACFLGGGGCYANCDGSMGTPLLTANDFSCFLNKYVGGDSYADCDGVGGLTANDFTCFLGKYTAGCS